MQKLYCKRKHKKDIFIIEYGEIAYLQKENNYVFFNEEGIKYHKKYYTLEVCLNEEEGIYEELEYTEKQYFRFFRTEKELRKIKLKKIQKISK